MHSGARKLPLQHLTIRVPWHDSGWTGTVCQCPSENTSCLVLKRIGQHGQACQAGQFAGIRWDQMPEEHWPPCVMERAGFMADYRLSRTARHPYAATSDQHRHLSPTPFDHPAYTAACVPFRWMLKGFVEGDENQRGLCDSLKLGYERQREPNMAFKSAFVQDRDNQLAMLDTFFGAIEPERSLCFFYAKRTPMADDTRRVIVGVGRVLSVGRAVEYKYSVKKPPLRSVLWERNVGHSIRPGFEDGFLFPYQELLARAETDPGLRLEEMLAFAPNHLFDNYSYTAEHLDHDGAIASLLVCAATLRRVAVAIEGPWDGALAWIDTQLNGLWTMRGPFPGLGSALRAFGLEHGNLVAYEIARAMKNENDDPWQLFERVVEDPSVLKGGVASTLEPGFRRKWKSLPDERRALLKLLSRFNLTVDQATRYYQPTDRSAAHIDVQDRELLENPYLLYELDRQQSDAISVGVIDRGVFPDDVVRMKHPVPAPSALEDAIDARRIRALSIATLEQASAEGHTLLPREWLIQRIRGQELRPPCPVDGDTLSMVEGTLEPYVQRVATMSGQALQLERYVQTRQVIAQVIKKRLSAKRHEDTLNWRKLVNAQLGVCKRAGPEAEMEERARTEKACALRELHCSRMSVLIGAAGTGKTTLLRALCEIPHVRRGGVLLLAPTGKARVRAQQQTGLKDGKTIAQFLLGLGRYDARSGQYRVTGSNNRSNQHKTVIVDECSMLTEEQLAALLDGLSGVERLILVGDPRQLPPIGAGRPFVDIVRQLAPENIEAQFPRVGPGYAELTVPRRQDGQERPDLVLAQWFSGSPTDAAADEIWDQLAQGKAGSCLELVGWNRVEELHERLFEKLVAVLGLRDVDDEDVFEQSLGGRSYEHAVFFWAAKNGKEGAAAKAEGWQILSPIRGRQCGVDALNRRIQTQFRRRAREWAQQKNSWLRKIPPPFGPQEILYGDKVIQVINQPRKHLYPRQSESLYLANGDIGIAVGQYKTRNFHGRPERLSVEFASSPGIEVQYFESEFGDDAVPPLELAYALTIHKAQGSEFKTTFVVLPNPCRLLSRELLYTALTRHQGKLIIFHQGDIRELRKYSTAHHSEIAVRLTNLFDAPKLVELSSGTQARFFEEKLIHRTERGELVRSKSELLIADKLYSRGIDYQYEKPLAFPDGSDRYPDFTIVDDDAGRTWYWEHLGLMHDPSYRRRWERKLAGYRQLGILPHDEGGGPQGTLIVTRDDPGGGLDAQALAALIAKVFQ